MAERAGMEGRSNAMIMTRLLDWWWPDSLRNLRALVGQASASWNAQFMIIQYAFTTQVGEARTAIVAKKDVAYEQEAGLVETTDPEIDKPVFRRPGFSGIDLLGEMDKRISAFVRKARHERNLTREEVARFLGLSTQVFGRYEKAISKLHVTRLVHLSEILGFHPMELVYAAAPHLFGKTQEEAADQIKLAKLIWTLPPSTISTLVRLVDEMHAISGGGEPQSEKPLRQGTEEKI